MAKKNSDYWRRRAEILEEMKDRNAGELTLEIEQSFNLAQKRLNEQIEQWYGRFADNNGISISEARQWLAGKDLAEFKWDVNEYIKRGKENAINQQWVKQLENASARFHVSKLEALQLKVQNTVEQLYGQVQQKSGNLFGRIYEDNYYHTAFQLQQGYGIGWDIAALNPAQLESVLSKPWTLDAETFSDRIWAQKQDLLNEVHKQLTQNMILGKAPGEAISAISKKFNASKHNAGRLVMTESAYFAAEAQKDAYKTLGVEEFEIVGTLDSVTCPVCGAFDGKHMPMQQYEAGVTAPPFHPWCRCTTAPYFSDPSGERFARDPDTGEAYYVPADMTFEDWKKRSVHVAPQATNAQNIGQTGAASGIIADSPLVKQMLNSLDALPFSDPAERQAFAEKLIDNIGVDRSNISVTIENDSNRGFCKIDSIDNDKLYYNQYNLQLHDDRVQEYQQKTAFHEAYHLKANGLETDIHIDRDKWVRIEETFAETSAHYALKALGVPKTIHPSYARNLVEVLPRLKLTPEFSGCTQFSDFGKIAFEKRLSGGGSKWGTLHDALFNQSFDMDAYVGKYVGYIEKNADTLLQATFGNNPGNAVHESLMRSDLDSIINNLKSGNGISTLSSGEEYVFYEVLAAAMNAVGVY